MRLQDEYQQLTAQITVNSQLRGLVDEYLKKNSYISLNQLSQKSDVAFTSLRRLTQKDSNGELSPHFVLNLSSYLLKEYNIALLIDKAQGPLKEFLIKHFSKFLQSSNTPKENSTTILAKENLSWKWVSLNSHYFLYIYLTKRSCGLNWNQLPEVWKLAFIDIHTMCLESNWIKIESKKNIIYWIEESLEIPESWKKKHENTLLHFYEQTSNLIEKTPIIEAEVSWNTFEKLSAILDRSNLECVKIIQAEIQSMQSEEQQKGMLSMPKLSIYLSSSLGVRGGCDVSPSTLSTFEKLGQSTPPELKG